MTGTDKKKLIEFNDSSVNLVQENINKLKPLFPEVVSDGKIDFDKLRLILGDEAELSSERYRFVWNGKNQAIKLAQQPTVATLKPNKIKFKEVEYSFFGLTDCFWTHSR